MLNRVRLFGVLMMLSFMSTVVAGINWKAVWLDAPYNPVHLKVGESLPVHRHGSEWDGYKGRRHPLTISDHRFFRPQNPGR